MWTLRNDVQNRLEARLKSFTIYHSPFTIHHSQFFRIANKITTTCTLVTCFISLMRMGIEGGGKNGKRALLNGYKCLHLSNYQIL